MTRFLWLRGAFKLSLRHRKRIEFIILFSSILFYSIIVASILQDSCLFMQVLFLPFCLLK